MPSDRRAEFIFQRNLKLRLSSKRDLTSFWTLRKKKSVEEKILLQANHLIGFLLIIRIQTIDFMHFLTRVLLFKRKASSKIRIYQLCHSVPLLENLCLLNLTRIQVQRERKAKRNISINITKIILILSSNLSDSVYLCVCFNLRIFLLLLHYK